MNTEIYLGIGLVTGVLLDWFLADPKIIPHPVVIYGKLIALGDRKLNRGKYRMLKGAFLSLFLIVTNFFMFWELDLLIWNWSPVMGMIWVAFFVFLGIAHQGLIREVSQVFRVLDEQGIEPGRKQLARVVGRDTSGLNDQQIRTAALETLAENLSDGVLAPLFYFGIAGIPGLMTYKLVNTLDSMIGYRSVIYRKFGWAAARIDDILNILPSRITALLMGITRGSWRSIRFIVQYGSRHKSWNAGYPEAALAGILNCRFGGPNFYHGQIVDKPWIGKNIKILSTNDLKNAIRTNHKVLWVIIMILLLIQASSWYNFYEPALF